MKDFTKEVFFKKQIIDWESQWATHAPGYQNGYLQVDLKNYDSECVSEKWPSTFRLKPGPGFGDLSHPTTRLMLSLMGKFVKGQNVIDVGCGSGILSFAALAMGAISVCGVDIDDEALLHAEANSFENGFDRLVSFQNPKNCSLKPEFSKYILLMNMIHSEQNIAWKSLTLLFPYIKFIVTSGILTEGRNAYLSECLQKTWSLLNEVEDLGWTGFVFENKNYKL